jgi:hypothetical protein
VVGAGAAPDFIPSHAQGGMKIGKVIRVHEGRWRRIRV